MVTQTTLWIGTEKVDGDKRFSAWEEEPVYGIFKNTMVDYVWNPNDISLAEGDSVTDFIARLYDEIDVPQDNAFNTSLIARLHASVPGDLTKVTMKQKVILVWERGTSGKRPVPTPKAPNCLYVSAEYYRTEGQVDICLWSVMPDWDSGGEAWDEALGDDNSLLKLSHVPDRIRVAIEEHGFTGCREQLACVLEAIKPGMCVKITQGENLQVEFVANEDVE